MQEKTPCINSTRIKDTFLKDGKSVVFFFFKMPFHNLYKKTIIKFWSCSSKLNTPFKIFNKIMKKKNNIC